MTRTTIITLAALAACSNEAPLQGHTCPCADGYTCCSTNVCVPEGEACSVVDLPTIDRQDLPCTGDEDTNGDGTIDLHWVFQYDADGNDIHDDGTNPDGTLAMTNDYSYDAAHQLLLWVWTPTGMRGDRYSYTYDELERTSTLINEWSDGTSYRESWVYQGMTAIGDFDKDGDGVYEERRTIQQDASGHPISGTTVSLADGTLRETITYTYNDAGKLVRRDRVAPDGTLRSQLLISYDDQGHRLKYTETWNGMLVVEVDDTFDAEGRTATETQLFPPNPPDKLTNNYCH
jgi:YD repeat-containing protein